MLDNKLVQIALVCLAFYVILQIMNGQVSQEHMDTVVQMPGGVTVEAPASSVVKISQPSAISTTVPANSLVTPELSGTGTASAVPVVTSSPSAAISTTVPSPLTSVSEDLLAAAPNVLPGDDRMGKQNANIFAPEPTDLDELFGKRGFVDPSDLIPKVQDAELYGGLAPDPNLAQNFLQNRWSMGIDVSKPKRGFMNDLRGMKYVPPVATVSPWQQPTQFPDLYRKSLGDIE